MLSNMEEGIKGEMFIPDIDEKSLDTVIGFVYTGQLEMTEDLDLQMMINAADKYDLPGVVTLVVNQMKEMAIKGEKIADILISAHMHGKDELREVALEKIRADREICQEDGFKERMDGAHSSIFIDLLNDLLN